MLRWTGFSVLTECLEYYSGCNLFAHECHTSHRQLYINFFCNLLECVTFFFVTRTCEWKARRWSLLLIFKWKKTYVMLITQCFRETICTTKKCIRIAMKFLLGKKQQLKTYPNINFLRSHAFLLFFWKKIYTKRDL